MQRQADEKFLREMRIADPISSDAWDAEGSTLRAELVKADALIAVERAAKWKFHDERNMWRIAAIAATALLVLLIVFGRK